MSDYDSKDETGFELFKQIVSNMPMIFYVIGNDWNFEISTGKGLQKLGLEPNQAVGLSAREMYKDYDGIIKSIENALNGENVHEEFHVGDMYIENFMIPHKNSQGEIIGVIGVSIDITERKNAEITLDLTNRFANAVVSSVPGMLYMYNSEGQLVFWNNFHKTMTGYSDKELKNMRLSDWYPDDPESLNAVTDGLSKMADTGFGEAEAYLHTKSGEKLPMYFTASPFVEDGQQYFVGIGVDISSRKKAEAELLELNRTLEDKVVQRTQDLLASNQQLAAAVEELNIMNEEMLKINSELASSNHKMKEMQAYLVESEKMAALGGLVAGVAHEVNTPIGVSVTAASHMADIAEELVVLYRNQQLDGDLIETLMADVEKASKIIVKNLNHAGSLIQNFKQLSADQSLEPQREFELGKYLDEILVSISPTFKKSNITINTHYTEDLMINGWPGAFTQIITNLVINSMQHAFLPDEKGQIDIDLSRKGDGFLIVFRDNGHGMEKDVADKIFEPFFTTKRSSGGTGLGLSIVYTIVTQRYRGSIRCESEPETGTSFIIELMQGGNTNE
jgi:PAS domain S-box-containing protein